MLKFKKDSLSRELEVLNSEDVECSGVTFFCGFAFSIFMLENLFLDTILLTAHSGILEPVKTSIKHL